VYVYIIYLCICSLYHIILHHFSLFCILRHLGSSCIRIACFGVFSGAEGAKKNSTRSIHSIQTATEEASFHSTSLLDPGSYKGGCSLHDPLTRSRQPQMKQQIDLLAPPTQSSTRPIYSTKGDQLYKTCWAIKASLDPPHSPPNQTSEHTDRREEASTQPIDHSEHRHKGADFAAPSLVDAQDRAFAQTASSLLSSSESRVSTFYYK